MNNKQQHRYDGHCSIDGFNKLQQKMFQRESCHVTRQITTELPVLPENKILSGCIFYTFIMNKM